MITYMNGNIIKLAGEHDAIVQQVNCMGIMGGGFARSLADLMPDMEQAYIDLCDEFKNNEEKLLGLCQIYTSKLKDHTVYICNAFGQLYGGYGGRRYPEFTTAYESILLGLLNHSEVQKIYIPDHIGCGIAGGDWDTIHNILINVADKIERETGKELDIVIVKFNE